MKKSLILLAALWLAPSICLGATFDDFGGDMAVSCPAPAHRVSATCSQSGTTVTCNVPNGAIFGYQEPIMIQGTGTALDYVFNGTTDMGGADYITSVSSNTLTLTAPASHTVSSSSGTLQPARFYVATVTTSFGTGPQICTPEGHWFWMQGVSDACTSIAADSGCSFAYSGSSISSATQSGGVVTITLTGALTHITQGMMIDMTGCADSTYNGIVQLQSVTYGTDSFTYNATGSGGGSSTTGCSFTGYGWQAKYGDTTTNCKTAASMTEKYRADGFNAITEDSDHQFVAFGGCASTFASEGIDFLPSFTPVTTAAFNLYSSDNLYGCATQPVKAPTYFLDRSITGFSQNELDWFDPNWGAFVFCYWNPSTGIAGLNYLQSPFDIGITWDDSDNQGLTRTSGFWHTVGNLTNVQNPALMLFYSDPHISLSNKAIYGSNTAYLYPCNSNWSKTLVSSLQSSCQSTTVPTSCSDASPCSFPDFLRIEYGTISALNSAWGSSYTTFGSSESAYSQETVTAPSSYTFAHTNVTPGSVQAYLKPSGGSAIMVSGDCPAFVTGCSGSAGTAEFLTPHSCATWSSCENTYFKNTGIVIVDSNGDIEEVTTAGETNTVAPSWPATSSCSGTQTSASGTATFTCVGPDVTGSLTYSTATSAFTFGGAGSLPSGESLAVSYTTGGWDAGGTGVMDEDGSHSWTTANGVCLVTPAAWSASTATTAFTDSGIIEVSIGGKNYWERAIQTGITGSGSQPLFSATLGSTLTDGTVKWETTKPVCDSGNGDWTTNPPTRSSATIAFANDVLAWLGELSAQYIHTGDKEVKAMWPDALDFGVNFGNHDWGSVTFSQTLSVENSYTDVGFWGEIANGSQTIDPEISYKQSYEQTYFTKPIVDEQFEGTSTGWEGTSFNCSNTRINCWDGLVARSQGFYSQVNAFLNFTSPSGASQYAGITWWTNKTNNAATSGSFALEDDLDNALDGVEDVTSTVSCTTPLTILSCGGEQSSVSWLGVNAMTCTDCIVPALALWYSGTAPSSRPTAISKKAVFAWFRSRAASPSTQSLPTEK